MQLLALDLTQEEKSLPITIIKRAGDEDVSKWFW
jgi:hypothetical protein